MSHAFVDITPDLARALESGLVLTSNDRLRRDLIRSYDLHQQSQGLRVWPSPLAFSLSGWWLQLYQRAADEDPDLPELLSRERAYLLFRELAPDGAADLSRQALSAWDLLQQWQIALDDPGFGSTEDSRLFAAWARRFREALSARNQLTTSQLADLGALDTFIGEQHLTCLEFESPSTQLTAWLARLRDCGTAVEMLYQPPRAATASQRCSFDDPEQELNAAAAWSRQLLESHGDVDNLRIGIVIPDLGERHQRVVRRFAAEFSPSGKLQASQPYDIGGGGSLSEQPIWQVAQDWLELCYRHISLKSLNRLYQSGYLQLPQQPEALPETLESVSLVSLARALGSKQLVDLASTISRGAQSLPGWFREFRIILNNAGWHAGGAGSLQFQAHQQLCRLLDELGHGTTDQVVDSGIALDMLLAAISLRLFAPQRDPAPIQILGYLETTGLSFSHLWVSGMDEDTWPTVGSSNPLLPMGLRRAYGLPRSTPADELDFATSRLDHWQHCTEQLIVSYPRTRGDREVEPSPLITASMQSTDLQLPHVAHPYFRRNTALEEIADDYGNPLPPGLLRGGTGLFTDQAGCPFRSWAIHRLGLGEPRTPHAFPDPLDRGRLFHGVMQLLYQEHLRDTAPINFPEVEILNAIERSLDTYYQRYPQAFLERERERLLEVVRLWLDLENGRPSFAVEAVETNREVVLGDVRINLRVDRLDLVDNALIIIDYKTGRTTLPAADGPLLEPQLPVYAMTDQRIEGVFYAQLDETRPRMSGIASSDVDLGQIRVTRAYQESWNAQTEKWRQELLHLAQEISSGYATVIPRKPRICDRCHLAGLCRIDERREVL